MNNRGSEWRKWDLHIHTPASFYWKGARFATMNAAEKTAEIQTFIRHLNDSDVSVFCLMDYWTFDGYNHLKDYLDLHPNELNKTVFPGMELRIESPTDYRLNIHVILSDNLTKQELADFKSELYISSIDKKLSNDALIKFAQSLDASKAHKHGYKDPKDLNEEELLQLGSKTVVVTQESLRKALSQIPGAGYIMMPYDTSDGLMDLDWESHPHADNYFMQSSHIFESRDQINIDLINGIKTNKNQSFFDNFSKTIGKAKPCVSGSDAHKYSEYGMYPSDKITWIKADCTFEGFRQILFEPVQRAKIQQFKPEQKEDKLVIDKVRFISGDGKFTPEPIYLNDNLNVIIGGKSSGKSILLYLIAKTLVSDKSFFEKAKIANKYNFREDDASFNFEITTKGGFTQLMDRAADENSLIPEVKYIPQNYLVTLAEPEQNKKGNELNRIVRGLINEDVDSQNVYNEFLTKVNANNRNREIAIDNYFEIADKVLALEEQLKTKASAVVLHQSIKANNEKVQKLNESAGLNPDQIAAYESLQNRLEVLKTVRAKFLSDRVKIAEYNNELATTLATQKGKADLVAKSLESPEFTEEFSTVISFLDDAIKAQRVFSEKFLIVKNGEGKNVWFKDSVIQALFIENTKQQQAIEKDIEPFLKNDAIKKEIEEINKSITADNAALQAINQLTKQIADSKKALEAKKVEIFLSYEKNFQDSEAVIAQLKIRTVDLEKEGLKIDGLVRFNFTKFLKSIMDVSDGRRAHWRPFGICSDDRRSLDDFELSDIMNDLRHLFNVIAETKEYSLTGQADRKGAIKILLTSYFFDYWQIEYKNDRLGAMSTGKASFVILMLIIGLSKSKAPILIDQPEDNLDNRSITSELVEYLRNKKIERQIILVTHNPNVVVNADAENIIVANQKGQSDLESNSKYIFDYTNGSLENSFEKIEEEMDILKCMGIREHIADVVEGGKDAFQKREGKYGFSPSYINN